MKDKKIQEINLKYLCKNSPTDVLSFDLSDNQERIFAQIIISVDSALRNAEIFKTTPGYEIYLYAVHGILHLLGYDDQKSKDRLIMQKRQEYLCSKILDVHS